MNTLTQALSNTLTAIIRPFQAENTHLITQEQFIKFRDAFKTLARDKKITAEDIVLYNVVRSFPVNRGFAHITNQIKLNNGQRRNQGIYNALGGIKFELRRNPDKVITRFDNFVTVDDVEKIMKVLTLESVPYK